MFIDSFSSPTIKLRMIKISLCHAAVVFIIMSVEIPPFAEYRNS